MSSLPEVEKILERQGRAWEMQQRAAREGRRAATREGPWVSVSKQFGSGGVDLARRLAGELGWQVFDKQILSAIAEHTDSREVILSRLDERAIGTINDYIAQLLVPEDPGRLAYAREMVRVVWGLARQGNAIILGRGANWFLDARHGLRLRVVAPLEQRAAAVAAERELSREQAERLIRADDAGQAAFIRQIFDRDIDDSRGYDLVINRAEFGPDAAVAVVIAALRHKIGAALQFRER